MNTIKSIGMWLWGIAGWISFALACIFSLFVALLVPGAERRERLVQLAGRAIFTLVAVRVQVRGLQHLPEGSCIVVANHASFVDGVLLKGYLPARFGFVIKGEMRSIPVVHFLLRRTGSRFVERKDIHGSARDARQVVKAAQAGASLALFPEGTFRHETGVSRFRPGAFVAAIKGNVPIVPIAISGTRAMLPAGRLLPRRAQLTIDILPRIAPGDAGFANSKSLAETARQRILTALDEPDLT